MSNLRDQMANVIGSPPPHRQQEPEAEERPLLRFFPNPSRYGSGSLPVAKSSDSPTSVQIKDHLTADISTRWTELNLIVNFFISGLIDAGAYNAYECFCSMQTGNTVFAALGVSNLPLSSPRLGWTKSVVSVLAFLAGAVGAAIFHRRFGERKRWVLAASFIIQAAHIAAAGVLVYRGHSSGAPEHGSIYGGELDTVTLPADPGFPWSDLIPITLLASQASAKVIASRVVECGGLPCIVITTLYADLVSDPSFFSAGLFGNAQRNRRLGSAVFYFFGAVIGGVCASHSIGFSGGLYIAAALQLATAIAWLVWREEEQTDNNDEDQENFAPGSWG